LSLIIVCIPKPLELGMILVVVLDMGGGLYIFRSLIFSEEGVCWIGLGPGLKHRAKTGDPVCTMRGGK